jgi:hypothetical protein
MRATSWSSHPVFVGIVAGALIGSLLAAGTLLLIHGGTTASDAPLCAQLNGTEGFYSVVKSLYEGHGNGSGPGNGPIYSTPPGPAAYPSEAVAQAQVVRAWYSLCQSSAYNRLVQEWGAQSASGSGATVRNATGIFELTGYIDWQAAHDSCVSMGNESWPCYGFGTWLINVATGAYAGPVTTFSYVSVPG